MDIPGSLAERRRQARALSGTGRLGEALASLLAGADDLGSSDPGAAARLRIDAVQLGLFVAGPGRALALAEKAVTAANAAADPAVLTMALTRMGDALTWIGRHAEARSHWDRAIAIQAPPDPALSCERANAALRSGNLDLAQQLAYEAVVRAREAESRDDLLDALTIASTVEVHLGSLHEALAGADQALALTSDRDGVLRTAVIGLVAWVTALLGDADRCRALIAEATDLTRELGLTAPGGFAAGMLALSQGRYSEAVTAFESKAAEGRFSPIAQALGIRPFVPSLVEAYARSGRRTEARELLAKFLDAAIATGQPRHVAPALRAKGVAHDDRVALDEAMSAHATWGNRFEEGRTLLARGELLRRAGQRQEARRDLRAGADRFEQTGALLWHARAVAELRAAGERTAATATPAGIGPERLTQQEAAIASLVAEGLTNREIAARLYLSVKTVEGHLTTVYAKLGFRSRSELIATRIGRTD